MAELHATRRGPTFTLASVMVNSRCGRSTTSSTGSKWRSVSFLAYSVPLFERGDRLAELRAEWLPFYSDALRAERLPAARDTCLGYLDRIPWFLDRELWFQALSRLHGAFAWFLLALHVEHRIYPIAYDKWIREQVVENLDLPELYERLPRLFEIARLESRELDQKATELRALVQTYLAC